MAGNSILVINAAGAETRVALVENGTIHEYYLERKREKGIVGNIYKGRARPRPRRRRPSRSRRPTPSAAPPAPPRTSGSS